ncbi:MAG: SDR family NAD(P)-dependent oxidoreductase, partial [Planctomycetes bacterium]|nr:SDR family NAD(P)-dependent oxidoreductase [Planctomycetota bacterium]
PEETLEGLLGITKENSRYPQDSHIRYEMHKRHITSWSEVGSGLKPAQRLPWKDHGVYLITGGVGGLGILFAREILRQAKDAKVILTGRSRLSPQGQSVLKELQALGGSVEYQKVDVSNLEQVNSLIESIQGRYGKLCGIIHSAGVISDNFILKKTTVEFRKVLLPKVTGTVNLDMATRRITLDFFVLFSSGAGTMGNPGQADYATANAFMDRFAAYRNQLVDTKQRQGQTLSINWPLWREGGMGVDHSSEAMMKQSTGMIAMKTETGIQAFYQSLHFHHSQVLVMEGIVSKMRKNLFSQTVQENKSPVSQAATLSNIDTGSLLTKIRSMLIQTVSKTLKFNQQDIDLDGELNEYGFDSITLTDFANRLNEKYHLELTPTLFFEYSTIGAFADYLVREHESVFVEQFCVGTVAQASSEAGGDKEGTASTLRGRRSRFVTPKGIVNKTQEIEPIAIVGMSGCFPEAENLDQFWQNLVEERDCISLIPKERWDWKALYGDPHEEVNRSNIKWGGFIKNVSEFDPLFFGISPREAELMDPQQRLLMTYVYLAIEDAGYSVSTLSGSNTGIFVGTGSSGYSGMIEKAGTAIEGYTSTGMVPSVGPNRMSYFLNFHGPSEPIETACSSSLVAIHRALQAMEGGSCDAAIVGGINTIITPEAHISFNKAGMLCEDGRCKTFSSQANGYVRGEGVGMLFLKKRGQAEADGDHIYGLIRGSAENHGGRANSLTAPNPKAQAELLKAAYKKSGLDPTTISYIEAHSTGTELGDPIEINGLKTAFHELYQEFGYNPAKVAHCGIGSVKSNIGHLELASGVAGVIKVLLQFKDQKLVSTLHCKEINPYIDLENTPFYILRESRDWNCLKDESGQEITRRAGVSSFGYGGANAHVVLEEYRTNRREAHSSIEIQAKEPVIIPLSARTKELLEQRARDLFEFLHLSSLVDLQSLVYTLQVGREAMEERLGFIVASIKELQEKLESYLSGNQEIEDCYQGQVKRNKETLGVFTADEELQEAIEKWIARKKRSKILNLWVKGLAFDWNKLYGETKPKRISLPTYPFARERYWIAEETGFEKMNHGSEYQQLSPLLHQNTSTLEEQRFTSTFTGKEFFLNDQQVKGEKVFPGVGYLEMARAAVEKASGEIEGGTTIHLKNIVWAQPIVVDGSARKVHIGLFGEDDGQIQYEVYTESDNEEGAVVHAQGVAEFKLREETPALDVQELQSQMNQGTMNAESCYKAFKETGIEYGEGYRGVREIFQGVDQVLARLSLPSSVKGTQSDYVLHPGLMDSALQSSIGLMLNNSTLPDSSEVLLNPFLPYALRALEIFEPCTSEMFAWVHYSGGGAPSDKALQLDIDICDVQGNVCMELRGVSYAIEKTTFEKKTATRWEFLKSDEPAQNSHFSSLSSEEKIQKFLQQSVAEQLQKSANQIQVDQSYFEIGIGSLGIVKVVKQLEALLDEELSPTLLFEYVNIQQLSAYVSQQFTNRVNSLIMVPRKVEIQQIKDSSGEDSSRIQNTRLLTPYKRKRRWVEPGKTNDIKQEESVNIKKRQSLNFPLSEGEKGLWLLQTTNPSMSAYNVPVCYQISGNIDLEYLGKAWDFVLEQYPILKARISENDGIPYHNITDECKTTVQTEQITIQDNEDLLIFLKEQVKGSFNLEKGPLTRIQVFSRNNCDIVLLITIHHTVSDGTSVVLLIESLLEAYQKIAAGNAPLLNPDVISYKEFVLWENDMLKSPAGKRHEVYWKQQLVGDLPVLEVRPDFSRPQTMSLHGKTLTKKLPLRLSQWMVSFSQSQNLHPSTLFMSLFKILLHKYTHEEDIIVGMPVSGRPLKKFESMMGYCINMIGIRSQVNPETKLLEFFKQLQLTQADALYHSVYPFLRVVQDLKIQRNSNISPLFQISYAYQNFVEETVINSLMNFSNQEFTLKTIEGIYQEDNFDLGLDVFEEKDNFRFHLKYNPDLYREETAESMLEHYCNLIETVSKNQQLCIKDYGLLSEKERYQILYEFNDTQVEYPKDLTIVDLFQAQVEKTPDNIAVVFDEHQLSYR